MPPRFLNDMLRNSGVHELDVVVCLGRVITGCAAPPGISPYTTEDHVMGFSTFYKCESLGFRFIFYGARNIHSLPHLEDTGNMMRFAVDHKGMTAQFLGLHEVELAREDSLHTRLHERAGQDEGDDACDTSGMGNKRLRKRGLTSEGWVSVDNRTDRNIYLQEVGLLYSWMLWINVVTNRTGNEF